MEQLFREMLEAWNAGDGKRFGTCFTEEADYITFNGQQLSSRKEIADVHQELFEGPLRGSIMEVSQEPLIRFLNDETAIVHQVGTVKLRWQKRAPENRKSINTNVVVKENGEWKITAFHNCRIKNMNPVVKKLLKIKYSKAFP
jgi:uncharacterized protein (TIGR02246 family)